MADEDSSVRVAVRIRPQNPNEVIDMCHVCTTVIPGEPQVTLGTDKAFTYDQVFDMMSGQDEIYSACIAHLVDGSLKGYNATVLAYGQTGSGKTYTMGTGFDVDNQPEQVGIIPRAIAHLFRGIDEYAESAKIEGKHPPDFKVLAQFMELYNEEIIDLFEPGRTRGTGAIKIHEDASGGIHVAGVTCRPVTCTEEALQCLRAGALSRTTASTQMNVQSSRSHAIFTLHVKQQRLTSTENETGDSATEFETLTAKFHFVDLAGSERLKRTKATGERAREGISINCGLLALGNVISALGDKSRKVFHVPYRDSKLTRLLQDSLGGNSQTVMIACVSPSDRDFMETLNTLKYANRARNIKNKVTINQDKSSRTIVLLRQEIQQLQLELLEYKQGKRVVGEDGEETVNDMFHENTMLQTEISNLRTRVKALQETVESLSAKNSQLLAERVLGAIGESGADSEVADLVTKYLQEIEELRAKLLESEATCQQLRKQPSALRSPRFEVPAVEGGNVSNLIAEAKKDLRRDMEMLSKAEDKRNGGAVEEDMDADSDNSDSEERDNMDDSDSETDTEDKEIEQDNRELAVLTLSINMKQKLIEELEIAQKRLHTMKQHYEDKLQQLQTRIRATQEERDKVLASISGQQQQPSTERVKRVKDEYEKRLSDMQRQVRQLQSAKKEHARLLRNQTQYEGQLRSLRSELGEMKRAKVKLLNKLKEDAAKQKEAQVRHNREIAQMRKESRRHENQIRTLEAERRVKEVVLKRKQEEVTALRKMNRGAMSNRAAGRVGARHAAAAKRVGYSPKVAKQKWQALETSINKSALSKQAVTTMEQDMDRLLQERDGLKRSMDQLRRRLAQASDENVRRELEEELEATNANIDYVQGRIGEVQQNIMEMEESKEGMDGVDLPALVDTMTDVAEGRYLIEKLYTMAMHQSMVAAQRELSLRNMEQKLTEVRQESRVQQQLLQHVLAGQEDPFSSHPPSATSSEESSRSASPTDNNSSCNGNARPAMTRAEKIRRRTALPEDLLYSSSAVLNTQVAEEALSEDRILMPPPTRAIARVPSAPGSLKTIVAKPSPVVSRKVYDRQESTSPRPPRRAAANMGQGNWLGSMEQGLDASPPGSPPAYRRLNSREENVFSRLTSGTTNDQQAGPGIITTYTGRVSAKSPLVCTHIAEGHSRAVLSVCATDDLLLSASKDRTVKVWDLTTGVEVRSLSNHPGNVTTVRYHEESRLAFSASSAYVRVWDLRDGHCVKVLCSSGLTTSELSSRLPQLSPGEMQLNDIALNCRGTVLYVAAGDKVRAWDLRHFECTAKLSGGHQAAVMCLAVGKVSEDEDLVVTGSKDHYIKVFEVNRDTGGTFTPKVNLNPPHYDGIQSLAIRGDVLFSGSRDMCIKKWDLSRQELIQSLNNAHKDWVTGLAFLPGGQMVVSGCRAGTVKLWAADSCHLLGEMKAHSQTINAITTNSTHVFTASNDGTTRLWKVHSRYDLSPDPA